MSHARSDLLSSLGKSAPHITHELKRAASDRLDSVLVESGEAPRRKNRSFTQSHKPLSRYGSLDKSRLSVQDEVARDREFFNARTHSNAALSLESTLATTDATESSHTFETTANTSAITDEVAASLLQSPLLRQDESASTPNNQSLGKKKQFKNKTKKNQSMNQSGDAMGYSPGKGKRNQSSLLDESDENFDDELDNEKDKDKERAKVRYLPDAVQQDGARLHQFCATFRGLCDRVTNLLSRIEESPSLCQMGSWADAILSQYPLDESTPRHSRPHSAFHMSSVESGIFALNDEDVAINPGAGTETDLSTDHSRIVTNRTDESDSIPSIPEMSFRSPQWIASVLATNLAQSPTTPLVLSPMNAVKNALPRSPLGPSRAVHLSNPVGVSLSPPVARTNPFLDPRTYSPLDSSSSESDSDSDLDSDYATLNRMLRHEVPRLPTPQPVTDFSLSSQSSNLMQSTFTEMSSSTMSLQPSFRGRVSFRQSDSFHDVIQRAPVAGLRLSPVSRSDHDKSDPMNMSALQELHKMSQSLSARRLNRHDKVVDVLLRSLPDMDIEESDLRPKDGRHRLSSLSPVATDRARNTSRGSPTREKPVDPVLEKVHLSARVKAHKRSLSQPLKKKDGNLKKEKIPEERVNSLLRGPSVFRWLQQRHKGVVKFHPSDTMVKGYRKMFDLLDEGKQGMIPVENMQKLLQGAGTSAKKAAKIIRHIDADHSGTVDFNEFVNAMMYFEDKNVEESSETALLFPLLVTTHVRRRYIQSVMNRGVTKQTNPEFVLDQIPNLSKTIRESLASLEATSPTSAYHTARNMEEMQKSIASLPADDTEHREPKKVSS